MKVPHIPHTEEICNGDIVDGVVVEVGNDSILLDVACKTDALLPVVEISSDENVQLNDVIRVKIVEVSSDSGTILVSRNAALREKAFDTLVEHHRNNREILGKVQNIQSHGFEMVFFGQVKAFMPFSHSSTNRVIDPESYMGKELPVLITKAQKQKNTYDIVASHKEYLLRSVEKAWNEFDKTYQEDGIVSGIVEKIFSTYACINIQGVVATVSQDEMSWLNKISPYRILSVGEEIRAKITAMHRDTNKIQLSIKAVSSDPWLAADKVLKVDSVLEGEIESIKEFGLFVKIMGVYQGLVHISEIDWNTHVQDLKHYKAGQKVQVKIIALDPETRRLALSVKQASPSPWEEYCMQHANTPIVATVKKAHKFGILFKLTPDIDGYLHQSQMGWGNKAYNPKEYHAGDTMEVYAVNADNKHKKARLSLKVPQNNPWQKLGKWKQEHCVLEVAIIKKVEAGLVVSVLNDIEGFIHVAHIANFERLSPQQLMDTFNIGDSIAAVISVVDERARKVYLSTKAVEQLRTNDTLGKYLVSDDHPTTNIADLTQNPLK